jgi:hypothetical protein
LEPASITPSCDETSPLGSDDSSIGSEDGGDAGKEAELAAPCRGAASAEWNDVAEPKEAGMTAAAEDALPAGTVGVSRAEHCGRKIHVQPPMQTPSRLHTGGKHVFPPQLRIMKEPSALRSGSHSSLPAYTIPSPHWTISQ